MNLDRYIELAEKMVVALEKMVALKEEYVKANNEFENYKGNLTLEEFEFMINKSKQNKHKYDRIQTLEERLCEAERKMELF